MSWLLSAIKAMIPAARQLAKLTPTPIDDMVIEILDALTKNPTPANVQAAHSALKGVGAIK